MPLITTHYKLIAITWGDIYSAAVDKYRFTIIDNQMAFFSDRVNNGRIEGWNVSILNLNERIVSISSGFGIIERFATYTYGPINILLDNNILINLYMRRKSNIFGGVSKYSNMVSFVYNDDMPPAFPININIISLDPFQMNLSWDENLEVDFSHYSIWRSIDDVNFEEVATTENNWYVDTNLSQNTLYYYKINAIDINGNYEDNSSVFAKTIKDLNIPANPIFFQAFARDSSIESIWDDSPSDNIGDITDPSNINAYELIFQPLNRNYEIDNNKDAIEKKVGLGINYIIVDGLENNISYRVTIYTINVNGILSDGISLIRTPRLGLHGGEISDIDIVYREGTIEDINVEMNISWKFRLGFLDPSILFFKPDRFLVTIIENGERESEPIIVLGINSTFLSVQVIPFRDNQNNIVYGTIKENTSYTIIIQTSDDENNISNGVLFRTVTPVYGILLPITNLNLNRQSDNSLLVSWDNSISEFFSHNLINVYITSLSDPSINISIIEENISKSMTYIIPRNYFAIDIRYEVEIIAVDIFGNKSLSRTSVFLVTKNMLNRPGVPNGQNIISLEGEIKLSWDIMDIDYIEFYRIYKAKYNVFLIYSNFSILDTIPSDKTIYSDYDVEDGIIYAYFITAINIFGEESFNPIQDRYASYPLLLGCSKQSVNFVEPKEIYVSSFSDVSVSMSDNDIYVYWSDEDIGEEENFDGYQILRSIGNRYSFEVIGNVSSSDFGFIDVGVLKLSTIYYYLVRKFRNESDLIATSSVVVPSNSILLATVRTYIDEGVQVIDIDESIVTELKNLQDLIYGKTIEAINEHVHNIDNFIDKRIDLNSDIIIDNWITSNFQKYITTTDIGGASQYLVIIEGELNNDFFKDKNGLVDIASLKKAENGFSPILYEVNFLQRSIMFASPLYSSSTEVIFPYMHPPFISLKLFNISETQNNLLEENVENLSATQVISGEITNEQLPTISHMGRINEELIPLTVSTETLDNFVYFFVEKSSDSEENLMGNSITFYDVIEVIDSEMELLAATSNGIFYSRDNGHTWEKRFFTSTAVFKLFYSSSLKIYFALTHQGVYYRRGNGFSKWVIMEGTEQVKVIRDIIQDDSGNLYISTDLGVYKLDINSYSNYFIWEQTYIFGPRSTESYALINDDYDNKIFVSNELGLLESTNEGGNWFFTSEFSEIEKIFQFINFNNYIFALTNNAIWRKNPGKIFIKIAELDVELARHMVIFNNIIYVSTDIGIFSSIFCKDIFSDFNLEMVRVFSEININNNNIVATSLSVINSLLFIGTDRRLFIYDNKNIWLQFEKTNAIIPSIYLNNKLQKLDFYYNNSDPNFQNVSFYDKISYNSVVTVTNKYKKYIAKYKGWADRNFHSKIYLRVNNNVMAESKDIIFDKTIFSLFKFPEYNDLNSNKETSIFYQSNVENFINDILSLDDNVTDDEESQVVSSCIIEMEKFLSQLYPETRVITTIDDTGNSVIIPLELPVIITQLWKKTTNLDNDGNYIFIDPINPVSVDITNGIFTFQNRYDKYDNLSIDLNDVFLFNKGELTHSELEDCFESVASGFPSSLSQIQQTNLIKSGIFQEKQFPTELKDYITNIQAKYIVPKDRSFYDVLNSDIDYEKQIISSNINLSLLYPATVTYISSIDAVFVGGNTGILSICLNKDENNLINGLEIKEVRINDISNFFVKKIFFYNAIIYCITIKNIYSSENFGLSWNKMDRTGLPNELYNFVIIKNNFIIGGNDGIYFKSFYQSSWEKVLNSNFPVEIMISSDFIFAVVDNNIYKSNDGTNFIKINHSNLSKINSLVKHKTSIFIATNTGLYTDGGTFYGSNSFVSLVDVANNIDISTNLIFNSIGSDNNKLIIGMNTGDYYILENNNFILHQDSLLETIHKSEVINNDIWLFGYDLFKISQINFPIYLGSGTPL